MSETEVLAKFVVDTAYDDIPDKVVQKSKEAILDFVGVALFGSYSEIGEIITGYIDKNSGGDDAPLLGRGRTGPPAAALANGAYGHALDYDDAFESIVLHPTAPTFAAAYAVSERANIRRRELLTAYTVGIETIYRVGHSMYPSHYDNGWHCTGTIGAFGAAAAAASVLGLSEKMTRHALGIVASSSSALKKNFGSMTKPLHSGYAAQSGVRAAQLAHEGFTANPKIFEGPLGYGSVMTPDETYDLDAIKDGVDDQWDVMDIGYKPYPSGVITHAAMDAMRDLVSDHDLNPGDVNTVIVSLEDAASEMLHHKNPVDALQAKFSIEFCLAAVLQERDLGIHEFTDEYVNDPATRQSMEKIERNFEPNLFDKSFANYGAKVTVTTTTGQKLMAQETFAPGSPNNPLSRDKAKFRECALTVLNEETVSDVAAAVESLDKPGTLNEFTAAVTTE